MAMIKVLQLSSNYDDFAEYIRYMADKFLQNDILTDCVAESSPLIFCKTSKNETLCRILPTNVLQNSIFPIKLQKIPICKTCEACFKWVK